MNGGCEHETNSYDYFFQKNKTKKIILFSKIINVSPLLNLDWQTAVSNSHTDCLHGPRLNLTAAWWSDQIGFDTGQTDDTVMSHLSCSSLKASDLLLVYDDKHSKMFYLHPPHHRDDGEDSLSWRQNSHMLCVFLYLTHGQTLLSYTCKIAAKHGFTLGIYLNTFVGCV